MWRREGRGAGIGVTWVGGVGVNPDLLVREMTCEKTESLGVNFGYLDM